MDQSITLLQLAERMSRLIAVPQTQNVWVTAELSDVAVRRGHCYMELLQKDADTGSPLARVRGVIWASIYPRLAAEFLDATGQRLASGIKVMVRCSATMHPVYGLSLVINGINPEFTMGDLLRRRREILERLKREGILTMNRDLPWPMLTQRVAIVSAPGAAGYGDFMKHLYANGYRLRFTTRLFPATMQGETAPRSVIAALNQIALEDDCWDCVVIIRGGGATSDLSSFEDYELAANVAQFPLPIICGIGHERDVTVLDYVANTRVKTPTEAADLLIGRGVDLLTTLSESAHEVVRIASERIAGAKEELSYYVGALPVAPINAVERRRSGLRAALMAVSQISARRVMPMLGRLDSISENIPVILERRFSREGERLTAAEQLLEALSPDATLKRGYSITRVDGHALTDAAQIQPGAEITTILANGELRSIVK